MTEVKQAKREKKQPMSEEEIEKSKARSMLRRSTQRNKEQIQRDRLKQLVSKARGQGVKFYTRRHVHDIVYDKYMRSRIVYSYITIAYHVEFNAPARLTMQFMYCSPKDNYDRLYGNAEAFMRLKDNPIILDITNIPPSLIVLNAPYIGLLFAVSQAHTSSNVGFRKDKPPISWLEQRFAETKIRYFPDRKEERKSRKK